MLGKRAELETFSRLRAEYEGLSGIVNPFDEEGRRHRDATLKQREYLAISERPSA